MRDLSALEDHYNNYIRSLKDYLPDGIINVDIELLSAFGLLSFFNNKISNEDTLTRYFQVIETEEKITLINDQFIIWIVPENMNETSITYALIALNVNELPSLELAFSTAGVYNTSHLVLRILEKFLIEIQETQDYLKKIEKIGTS